MVSLVVVSHSYKLAEGIKDLAEQMCQGKIKIVAAGGLDENTLGTNFEKILNGISEVYTPDGVLVIMDLGSAVLTTSMAVEMLPEDQQKDILLCEAPVVEGTIAAVVEAANGGSLASVNQAACSVIHFKKIESDSFEQLGQTEAPEPRETLENRIETLCEVLNPMGLHARPASVIVQETRKFEATVELFNRTTQSKPANSKSIFSLLGINARKGQQVKITATGVDAAVAAAAVKALFDAGFGEMDSVPVEAGRPDGSVSEPGNAAKNELVGIPASPGMAVGPVEMLIRRKISVTLKTGEDPAVEERRFRDAIDQAKSQLEAAQHQKSGGENQPAFDIFTAHRLFLEDQEMAQAVVRKIRDESCNAEYAFRQFMDETCLVYQNSGNEVLEQRVVDIEDVGSRVLSLLMGVKANQLAALNKPVILVADELSPTDITDLDTRFVLGFCLTRGGATSHASIIAKSLNIPMVAGLGGQIEGLDGSETLVIDGNLGKVIVNPDEATTARYQEKIFAKQVESELAGRRTLEPAITLDGRRVLVAANAGDLKSVIKAVESGADGIGLLRTEFLFLNREDMPGEEEQFDIYRKILEITRDTPVIFRTLDIGGDKNVPWLTLGEELNPSLGLRAIRLCLFRTDIFRAQLRALLRAGGQKKLSVMLPMIVNPHEVIEARRFISAILDELKEGGATCAEPEVGIMVETPAAAVITDLLAEHVDFFSIGSNDLIQYSMACDRTNERVAYLYQPSSQAITRQIKGIVEAAHRCNKWVGLCGDMASNIDLVPTLVGLGLDELSAVPSMVPLIKEKVRSLSLEAWEGQSHL